MKISFLIDYIPNFKQRHGKSIVDSTDKSILRLVQHDATLSLDYIASRVGASKTPVWNRLKRLKADGVIKREVAVLDPSAVGLDTCFFVLVKTREHCGSWQARVLVGLQKLNAVMGGERVGGEIDYIRKVRVGNAQVDDACDQSLISEVKVFNVRALLSMEELKSTTELPI